MRSWRGWSWDDGNFGGSGLEPHIKDSRTFSVVDVPEQAKHIDHSDRSWMNASGIEVNRKELVRSLTHDISQQYGREMAARVTKQGNVEIERVKSLSRGFSISR